MRLAPATMVLQAHMNGLDPEAGPAPAPADSAVGKPSVSEVNQHVLLVDDDPLMRATLREILEKAGYGVATADSAQAALQTLGSYEPEIVVTDIFLPGTDGVELIEAIRCRTPEARILAISGYDPALLRMAMLWGAAACLQKPFSSGDFLKALRELVTEH